MSDTSPDHASFNSDYEIRKLEVEAGKYKVLVGTAVVGVSVAFFPFAQSFAENWFEDKQASFSATAAGATNKRDFLESLSSEARSPDLEERIILAEYYANLASDEDERSRWGGFLTLLVAQRKDHREAEIAEKRIVSNENSTPEQIAVAATLVEQLDRSAVAGSKPQSSNGTRSIPELIIALDSGDSLSRRRARAALAEYGMGLVIPAAAELTKSGDRYRLNLGLIVALAKMIDENRGQREEIIELLDIKILKKIMVWATDSDPTIRTYAGNFLFDLGDPRAFEFFGALWPKASNENGRYNLALIAKSAAPFISKDEVANVEMLLKNLLPSGGDKTDKLLQQAIKALPHSEG